MMSRRFFSISSVVASVAFFEAYGLQKQGFPEWLPFSFGSSKKQDLYEHQAAAEVRTGVVPMADNDFLYAPVECVSLATDTAVLEERLQQFEAQSLNAVVATICAACDQKVVTEVLMFERHLKDSLEQCDVKGYSDFVARMALVHAQLINASHHRDMMVAGKDPKGFYSLTDASLFAPVYDTTPSLAAKFFMGRAASVDFATRRAIETNEGLDVVYHFAHRAAGALQRFMTRTILQNEDFETVRAKAVIAALSEHVDGLQDLLRVHGADPGVMVQAHRIRNDALASVNEEAQVSSSVEGDSTDNSMASGSVVESGEKTDTTLGAAPLPLFVTPAASTSWWKSMFDSILRFLSFKFDQSPELEETASHASETEPIVEAAVASSVFSWKEVDCSFPSVAAITLDVRVKKFEETSLGAVVEALCSKCSQTNVTDALTYAERLQESLRECGVPGNEALVAHVQEVLIDLVNASHQKELVARGHAQGELYAVGDAANLVPAVNSSSREVSDWYMGKVATVDQLTQKAIDTNMSMNEALHVCNRLELSMVRFLSLREDMLHDFGTERAKRVVRALQERVSQLGALLRAHGAHSTMVVSQPVVADDTSIGETPSMEPVFDMWTSFNCTPRPVASLVLQQRIQELEDKSLVALLVAVCARCDQKSVGATFQFARHLQDALAMCRVPMRRNFTGRVDAVAAELLKASRHRIMVMSGKDPRGLYAINDEASFSPKYRMSLTQAAQFFLAKATSIDSMTRLAIDEHDGLSEAYHYAHRLVIAISSFLAKRSHMITNDFMPVRAKVVMQTVQAHMRELQKMLMANGAQPLASDMGALPV